MSNNQRRQQLIETIKEQQKPISATKLAELFNVSRQSIVGDIALLRAQGVDIIATARGYLIQENIHDRYIQKIACQHNMQSTQDELFAIVDLGGEVIDVIIEHELYGEFSGKLNIATRWDAEQFVNKQQQMQVKLLSELTYGIHLHTIACKDKATFERIVNKLNELGYLYQDAEIPH